VSYLDCAPPGKKHLQPSSPTPPSGIVVLPPDQAGHYLSHLSLKANPQTSLLDMSRPRLRRPTSTPQGWPLHRPSSKRSFPGLGWRVSSSDPTSQGISRLYAFLPLIPPRFLRKFADRLLYESRDNFPSRALPPRARLSSPADLPLCGQEMVPPARSHFSRSWYSHDPDGQRTRAFSGFTPSTIVFSLSTPQFPLPQLIIFPVRISPFLNP